MKLSITENPKDTHDHDDVRFINDAAEEVGYGFRPHDEPTTIALVKCPRCHRENYAMSVASGRCAWCPFDANNLDSSV